MSIVSPYIDQGYRSHRHSKIRTPEPRNPQEFTRAPLDRNYSAASARVAAFLARAVGTDAPRSSQKITL